jgi:small-conductance mechanosensitive channel
MKSALAGKILPITTRLWTVKIKYKDIISAIRNLASPSELILLILLGWTTVPILQYPYNKFFIESSPREMKAPATTSTMMEDGATTDTEVVENKKSVPFHQTIVFMIADHIARASKISILVYAIDCMAVTLKTLGFDVKNYSQIIAKVIYTTWFYDRVKQLKKYLIFKFLNVLDSRGARKFHPGAYGRANILNHLLDAMILSALTLSILDVLQVEGGLALKSAFAFGSAGTLLFSFASKDLATQLVSGLALTSSDKVYEGEEVAFGDGTKGVIVKMGWMQTLIRSPDEMITSIPNTQLANQRITNISRIRKCQVKQILYFEHNDADKFPAFFDSVKREVKAACLHVIVDGTRPFRVVWSDIKNGLLEVTIDMHFNIKPSGDVYHDNRQRCLLAIYRAIKTHGMKLIVPEDK